MTGHAGRPATASTQFDLVVASELPAHPTSAAILPVGSAGLELAAFSRIVAARGGCWITAADQARPTPDVMVKQVTLAAAEAEPYRAGHCASTLGQLYHGQPAQFDHRWSDAYRSANRRYAAEIAVTAAPHATVVVYDYHLQLVPGMLRRLRPDVKIVFVLAGGFPPVELFYQLPDRDELMAGMLGADVIAVAHHRSRRSILDLAHELAGRPHSRSQINVGRREVRVVVAPIPADTTTVARLAAQPSTQVRAAEIRASLDCAGSVFLSIAGPTDAEGVEQRMTAFDRLLTTGGLDPARDAFVHLALGAPRSQAQHDLRARVERLAARINGEHASVGRCVVHYLNTEPDAADLTAFYLAADVMIATPMHGGPVAVAAEYLAARTGRLVLSELTTTAGELPSAHLVNPLDGVALQDAIAQAATAPTSGERPSPDALTAWLDQLLAPIANPSDSAVEHQTTNQATPVPRQLTRTALTH